MEVWKTNGLVRAYGAHEGTTMNHMNHLNKKWVEISCLGINGRARLRPVHA